VSLWLAPLFLLQCPWFSSLVFWQSHWVLAYSFHSSRVVWLGFLRYIFFKFLFYLQSLRFCLLLVLVCWSGLPLCFLFDYRDFLFPGFLSDSFFWGFPNLCLTLLLLFVWSSLINVSLFIVSFVSLWC
jgi:hypothetical protein